MSIDVEIIEALNANPTGLRRRELFGLCESAETDLEVSKSLAKLKELDLIEVSVPRKGNVGPTYVVREQVEQQAAHDAVVELEEELPELLPGKVKRTLDEVLEQEVAGLNAGLDHFDLILKSLVAIKQELKAPRVIEDLELKLQCLNQMAALFNEDVAETLRAIVIDLEAA